MTYSKQTWFDAPSMSTPIDADRLNYIEDGIEATSLDAASRETPAGAQARVNVHISNPTAAHSASAVSVIPVGNISSTNVQSALQELDAEKVSTLDAAPLSNNIPLIEAGSGAAGTALEGSRSDHVHPLSTSGSGTGLVGSPLTEASITGTTTLDSSAFGKIHACSGTSANYTITLPAASGNAGKVLGFRMVAGLTKLVTLDGNASETIDGSLTRILYSQETAILECDGSNWQKVAGKFRPMSCAMRLSANQTALASSTVLKINLNQADVDTSNVADTSGFRMVIRRPGIYGIHAQVYFQSGQACTRALSAVYLNGTQLFSAEVSAAATAAFPVPQSFSNANLNAGDVLELKTFHDSASARDVLGGSGASALLIIDERVGW